MYHNQQKYVAMINVGKNPTFHKEHNISVEAHILDFNQDVYGESISLEFKHYIREEISFSSSEQLISQLSTDISTIRNKLKAD